MTLAFVVDVDGVLTTGQFLYSPAGKAYKVFGPHDADGLKLLAGKLDVRFITADKRGFPITQKRLADMGYDVHVVPERERYAYIRDTFGFARTIYMGDGIYDAPILRDSLLGIAPANARVEARTAAHIVTPSRAGEGAVCDACLVILQRFFPDQGDRAGSFLDVARSAAIEAGAILRRRFDGPLTVVRKTDGTYVTEADHEAETAIRSIICASFPDHAIIGEEQGSSGQASVNWYVDPLDGTRNFSNGISACCISIGIESAGRFHAGLIYNFLSHEMFWAEEGAGAYGKGERIHVNTEPHAQGVLGICASFRGQLRQLKPILTQRLAGFCSSIRMTGSNALQLADVARGQYIAHVADAVDAYDFAAGVVLVREAGGHVSDAFGEDPTRHSTVVVASNNRETHDAIITVTRDVYARFAGAGASQEHSHE